ncbi:PREDICTED: uncharacterized protein LOC105585486 [Cercocebus atys]|uniref:uncharacterized protein LOC105585486 n=1 Tax=Cercocebus atys TaxID=9531 RepID=UPI0005F53117|nr:PREDICTED: uncharacterized protein LOC105585486 [Cercocebus atys]XP_011914653.1 PREDICTED: uncharacterized protein LOC105585486 [Cercocebus atys]
MSSQRTHLASPAPCTNGDSPSSSCTRRSSSSTGDTEHLRSNTTAVGRTLWRPRRSSHALMARGGLAKTKVQTAACSPAGLDHESINLRELSGFQLWQVPSVSELPLEKRKTNVQDEEATETLGARDGPRSEIHRELEPGPGPSNRGPQREAAPNILESRVRPGSWDSELQAVGRADVVVLEGLQGPGSHLPPADTQPKTDPTVTPPGAQAFGRPGGARCSCPARHLQKLLLDTAAR